MMYSPPIQRFRASLCISERRTVLTVLLMAALTLLGVSSCATPLAVKRPPSIVPKLDEADYTSFDGDILGYQKWRNAQSEPEFVMIGVHGISGYSGDYENFGKFLIKSHPEIALYAPETRGQGMDLDKSRRGDIHRVKEWYHDLYTFTRLVRKLHPKAKVIWFGESMGSLITTHAYNELPAGEPKPDAMVISSPIIDVSEKVPRWKLMVARGLAAILPKLRISLETLSEAQHAVVTADDIHEQQAAKNEWYIKRYTLRLLLHLEKMAAAMPEQVAKIDRPTLVLHGGRDIFTPSEKVHRLSERFPASTPVTSKHYPDSYHLLMYDLERDKIFQDVTHWVKQLK